MATKLEGFIEVVVAGVRQSVVGSVERPEGVVGYAVPAENIIARAILCSAELTLWDPAYMRALVDAVADPTFDPAPSRDRAMTALRDLIDEATRKLNYGSN